MCKSWQGEGTELSFAEAKAYVDGLAEFITAPIEINVMGGEPLAVPWCLELCDYIAEKGFGSIISTNAYLIDKAMAQRIAASKLSVLALSLESFHPEVHDYYRGRQGTHAKVMNAVRQLEKYAKGKLIITLLSIVMDKNLDELIELTKWVDTKDLFQHISFLALVETGLVDDFRNWFRHDVYKDMWPQDSTKLDHFLNQVIAMKQKGSKIWNPIAQLEAFKEYYRDPVSFMQTTKYKIHDYIVDLDARGDVFLSGMKLGNMNDRSLKEMWFSDEANRLREEIKTKGPSKRSCVINFVCAFPSDNEYMKIKNKGVDVVERRAVHHVAEQKQDIRKPKFSVIELMRECPMQCLMCNNWHAEQIKEQPSIDDIMRYVSQLADIVEKPFEINLSGGEAILRDRIFELIGHIVSFGFTCSLTTSAYPLTDDLLGRIVNSGLTLMPISLDSMNPRVHDYLRGKPGTFERVMHAFKYLLKNRGSLRNLTIQTIIMKPNLKDVIDVIEWAHQRDIAVSLMAVMRPSGTPPDQRWFKQAEHSFLFPQNTRKVHSVINKVIRMKERGYRIDNSYEQLWAFKDYYKDPTVFIKNGPCSLGDGIVNVGPEGNVYLCWEMEPLGNIKTDDIRELWFSRNANTLRNNILQCKRNCSEMVNCFFEGGEHAPRRQSFFTTLGQGIIKKVFK